MQSAQAQIKNLSKGRGPNTKLMGLDLGTKTIGIAFSDTRLKIATARETLKRVKFTQDASYLLGLANNENVCGIILGLPLNMDGTEGPRAQSTRAFARNLSRLTELPILFQDERLSTHAAHEAMLEADLSRKKRAQKVDAIAAAVILQAALDQLNRN